MSRLHATLIFLKVLETSQAEYEAPRLIVEAAIFDIGNARKQIQSLNDKEGLNFVSRSLE
jgi:hypothetical protein